MFQLQEEHEIPGVPLKVAMAFHQAFEERNTQVLFKQNQSKKIDFNLSRGSHIVGWPIHNGSFLQSQASWQYLEVRQEHAIDEQRWYHEGKPQGQDERI
jgi:hypothetical protein